VTGLPVARWSRYGIAVRRVTAIDSSQKEVVGCTYSAYFTAFRLAIARGFRMACYLQWPYHAVLDDRLEVSCLGACREGSTRRRV
jgi:hypothetical protein